MVYIIEKSGKIVFKAMWTDHKEIESVLANLVVADRLRGHGLRVKPSFTERINYIPAEYACASACSVEPVPKPGKTTRKYFPVGKCFGRPSRRARLYRMPGCRVDDFFSRWERILVFLTKPCGVAI